MPNFDVIIVTQNKTTITINIILVFYIVFNAQQQHCGCHSWCISGTNPDGILATMEVES